MLPLLQRNALVAGRRGVVAREWAGPRAGLGVRSRLWGTGAPREALTQPPSLLPCGGTAGSGRALVAQRGVEKGASRRRGRVGRALRTCASRSCGERPEAGGGAAARGRLRSGPSAKGARFFPEHQRPQYQVRGRAPAASLGRRGPRIHWRGLDFPPVE